jgi:signal peptidase I
MPAALSPTTTPRRGARRLQAMRRHPLKKLLAYALGLIVLGCVWFYFAPSTLGGSTNYVVTHGISMEPLFHTGDLAIVRSQPRYHVGEIVAYHNKMLHVVALHRIIGREGDRYLFKGDNNNFIDPEHPRAGQLIGALWIHIRGGGSFLQSFSSPARAGLLIALGMLLLTGGVFARRHRRRRRERRAVVTVPRAPRTVPLNPSGPVVAILATGILVSLPFLLLALLAFSRAPSTRHAVQIPYKQSGTLSYSADAAPSSVYPEGVARTGEPLFTQLVNDVNLRFDYKFATQAKHSLAGKGSLRLLLSANDGWHRTLQLGSPTYFKGDHATVTSTLDLGWLLALVHNIEVTTHVDSGYTFAVVPTVVTRGNVGGVPVHATFTPTIQFSANNDEVSIQGTEGSGRLLTSGGANSTAGPLTPSASGSATGEQSQPRSLSLGPWRMSVSTARAVALSAIGIILAAVLVLLALIRPLLVLVAPRRDETASILARYRGLIIPVAHITPLRGVPVIDVADMDALARIAEHYDRSILHETTGAGDTFWVADESGQFRYTIGSPATSAGGDSAVTSPATSANAKSAVTAPSTNDRLAAAPSTNGHIAPPASPASDHIATSTLTESEQEREQIVAPAWARDDQAVPAWTDTAQLVAPVGTENGHDPTLVWTASEQTSPEPPQIDIPAPAWSDANSMPATASFDNGTAYAPASSNASPAPPADLPEINQTAPPAWSQSGQIQTPEWAESGQVSAPGWDQAANDTTVEEHPAELPSHTGYVRELEHPGPFAAPQWQPMPEHAAAASSNDSGWVPLSDQAWGSEPDTLAYERVGWQSTDVADADLTPAGASVASFTGLEWTTNS